MRRIHIVGILRRKRIAFAAAAYALGMSIDIQMHVSEQDCAA
jgi:hypothetical protein